MKLIDLKKMLDKMSAQELDKFFFASNGTEAGMVERVFTARSDLYGAEGNTLQTLTQLRKMGCSQEEIDECPCLVWKGGLVIEFE